MRAAVVLRQQTTGGITLQQALRDEAVLYHSQNAAVSCVLKGVTKPRSDSLSVGSSQSHLGHRVNHLQLGQSNHLLLNGLSNRKSCYDALHIRGISTCMRDGNVPERDGQPDTYGLFSEHCRYCKCISRLLYCKNCDKFTERKMRGQSYSYSQYKQTILNLRQRVLYPKISNSNFSQRQNIHCGCKYYHKTLSAGPTCGGVPAKGVNSLPTRKHSSSPLSNVQNSNQAVAKTSPDDCGRPWTVLQARDYGKSIPVLQEPVTVTPTEIKKFLTAHNLKFDVGHTCFITSCPRLNKRKVLVDDSEKMYVNMTTGSFVCHACRKFGAWPQLQDNVTLLKGARRKKDQDCFPEMASNYNVTAPRSAHMMSLWENSLPLAELSEDAVDNLLHSGLLQGLSMNALKAYGVKVDDAREAFLIPVYFVDNTIHAIKKISVRLSEDGMPKGTRETIIPRGDVHGLIGWNTITPTTDEVVLTASEFDAIAVYQETKVPAIALPKGDSVLPQEVLPLLEQFKKIVLWFKNDIRSWEAAKQFTKKLNDKRCFVIRPSCEHPNALEALQNRSNLHRILEHARPVSHQSITAFSQLRQEVYSELAHVEQVAGVKWKRYPHLNKLLKGHRRGELTIFTGPTGSGKTTFISDYSLDLCVQGVNTLWGSFEINNVRLMKMMLTQYAQQNMSKNLKSFDFWADQFENLPMYFMTFFGQESIKKVIETMSHAVYVHDIAHVIVDNLQFMMGVDSDRMMMDRFQRQDQIVAAFRKFATTMNCHVTVVVHPRKEKDNDELTTASIYGSAKAAQEADNVMILQDKRLMSLRGKKYLQIAKNRFDGELGVMLLKFDKDTLSFAVKPQKSKDDKGKTEEEVVTPQADHESSELET